MTTWKNSVGADLRKSPRRTVHQPVMMVNTDGSMIAPSTMLDVSAGGARLKVDAEVTLPPEFILLLSKFDRSAKRRCSVAWRAEGQIGVRFVDA
jgi:hypothetical protein